MRISTSLWLPALASLVQAELGFLTITQSPKDRQIDALKTTITADTARLIIASRLGLEHFHSLGEADDSTLQAINDFGGERQRLFTSGPQQSIAVLLGQDIKLDDVPRPFVSEHNIHLEIENAPNADANRRFLSDLATQSSFGDAFEMKQYTDAEAFANAFVKMQSQYDAVIALAMPKTSHSKSASWGTYSMPAQAGSLQKRRQPVEEAPLSDSTHSHPSDAATLTPNTPSIFANNSKPLKGILPHCFSSLSACQSTTRNCTGHGSCRLQYTDKDAGKNGAGAPCYSCACTADVRTNADGTKKTTRWGGPACQKKDVVMPFWLLAGFTVVLVSVVSWGIGLLYTMGSQELPSVIGAGVSGPPRR